MAERAGRETPSLEVAGSNAKRSKFFLIRCLFIFFSFILYYCFVVAVFSLVSTQLRFCVTVIFLNS